MNNRTTIQALNDAIAVTLDTVRKSHEMPSRRTFCDLTQSIAESLVVMAGYVVQAGPACSLTEQGQEWLDEWRARMEVGL